MNQAHASPRTPPWTDLGGVVGVRLGGRWLVGARAAWVVVAGLDVGLFGASLPAAFAHLRTVCTEGPCTGPQLSAAGARAFEAVGLAVDAYAVYSTAVIVVFAAAYFTLAGLVFWRRSDEPVALLASLMLVTFGAAFPPTLDALGASDLAWRWPSALVGSLGLCLFVIFFYLFPDGRFVPAWTRALAAVTVAVQVPASFFADSPLSYRTWPPALVFLLFLGWFGTVLFAQVHRYRRVSGPVQRQQTKWVVFGLAAALIGFLAVLLGGALLPAETLQDPFGLTAAITATYLFLLLVPLSMAAAILRYRLWDIDLLVNRALVYGALTAAVVALYVLFVGGLAALFRTTDRWLLSLAATGVVAVLFQPLRERLQRAANRLVYGERDDPYGVLSRLRQRLEATLAPEAVLPTIAQTIREALRLPYAAVALAQEGGLAVVAASGTPGAAPLRLPLVYQQTTEGELLLGHRAGEESFGAADRRLLDDLAHHAGVAAHAVRLSADLQRSRERLVGAREEERRRLRRDLHDGLGPALSSAMLKVGAARRRLPPDAAVDDLLVEVREDLRGVVADIRRLVHDLRPPALDQLGLPLAVRALAERCGAPGEGAGGSALRVEVEVPERLPPLPAAVEVAAYRIAQEALTNAVRHARASACTVRLALEAPAELPEPADASRGQAPVLCVEVTDDGVGLPPRHRPGVGLASMRERAAELGGTCTVAARPSGGTRVLARLPVAEA